MAAAAISYGEYLDLPRLLSAQHPRSQAHDEMVFIIIHQASELWLKLCLHELAAARAHIEADDLAPAFKMLARVARAQTLLIQSWDVLATMTPADYTAVRPHLGTSSGFQSWQYRMLEAMMGHRKRSHLGSFAGDPPAQAALAAEQARPSIYDAAVALLARRGFAIPAARLAEPAGSPEGTAPCAQVEAAWATIYRDPAGHWELYELAEKLVDLEYHVQRWRFGHLKTVERIIGFKRGTGGTAGVAYLAGVLQHSFFPELLSVRTAL